MTGTIIETSLRGRDDRSNLRFNNSLLHFVRNDGNHHRNVIASDEGTKPTQFKNSMERGGHIYILTNKTHRVLYTGLTSDLTNRLYEHRTGFYKDSFTSRYNVTKLVYFEGFTNIEEAIAREKQIKAGSRQKKLDLIIEFNPG